MLNKLPCLIFSNLCLARWYLENLLKNFAHNENAFNYSKLFIKIKQTHRFHQTAQVKSDLAFSKLDSSFPKESG